MMIPTTQTKKSDTDPALSTSPTTEELKHEEHRVTDLASYDLFNEGTTQVLDTLTEIGREICQTPICTISLIDSKRLWYKSGHGLNIRERRREDTFSQYLLSDPGEIFVIEDTLEDPRFKTNKMVLGDPFIRFYAGVPLVSQNGYILGHFSVMDHEPRKLSPSQLDQLTSLGSITMGFAELNRTAKNLQQLFAMDRDFHERLLRASREIGDSYQSTDELLLRLINCLDPKIGWLSARIVNMQTGTVQIMSNPELLKGKNIPDFWNQIGASESDIDQLGKFVPYVSAAPINPDWIRLVIPVAVRKKHVATFEFIFPVVRFSKKTASDILHLMASNLLIVTELTLGNHAFREQLTIDPESGVSNRTKVMNGIDELVRNANYSTPDSALLYIDLNSFQDVNDRYGYLTGDILLKEVAGRLMSILRKNDLLGRVSGDDFVFLSKYLSFSDGDLELLISNIQGCFAEPFIVLEQSISILPNIGVVMLTEPNISTEKLLRNGEKAMRMVKSGQKGRSFIAEGNMLEELDIRRRLDQRFKEAFEAERLVLHYQPIIKMDSGKIVGAEALLRIVESDGSFASAGQYLHSLIGQDLLLKVDEWVLLESIKNFNQNAPGLLSVANFFLSINITPETLTAVGHAKSTLTLLECGHVSPGSILIEVSEGSLLTSSDIVSQNLDILHRAGVKIAVDDFGTGFSNLQRLAILPVDLLKIDRSLIAALEMDETKRIALLTTACSIAKNLQFGIIAEGMENQSETDILKSLGCEYGQGYYYSKPIPMAELLSFITNNSSN